MNARVQALIDELALEPHPEGGYFREVHRSSGWVAPDDEREPRSALTTIYFLIPAGNPSRVHRLRSDEVWVHLEGDAAHLQIIEPGLGSLHPTRLGPVGDGRASTPVAVVPAHHWQAAETAGEYSLVSCTVAPGFEFEDFAMLRDDETECARFVERWPSLSALI